MSEFQQVLEQYLKAKFSDKTALSIERLEKMTNGWESDNYLLGVEYGGVLQTRTDWVWRLYWGAGTQAKASKLQRFDPGQGWNPVATP